MRGLNLSWFLITIILCLTLFNLSEANNVKLPSAFVVGTVYCDTCFQDQFSSSNHFISGASVAVECGDSSSSRPSFRKEVKTNEHGEFKVSLPFSVAKHVRKIKNCSVKLLTSNEPYCSVASTASSSSSLHLKSRKQGIHIFSAGFFTFKPLKQPELCNQKTISEKSMEISSMKSPKYDPKLPSDPTFSTPISNPKFPSDLKFSMPNNDPKLPSAFGIPSFPPNPFQPPPSILPPNPFQPPPSIFPPNPFQPPPSIFPPNPFQPPPSIFPPNPFQPSPPPFSLLPPIPFLTPSPPPPSPPVLPFPLPPFPFQPTPGNPPPFSSRKIP